MRVEGLSEDWRMSRKEEEGKREREKAGGG